jgi:hypothetical protein
VPGFFRRYPQRRRSRRTGPPCSGCIAIAYPATASSLSLSARSLRARATTPRTMSAAMAGGRVGPVHRSVPWANGPGESASLLHCAAGRRSCKDRPEHYRRSSGTGLRSSVLRSTPA